VRLALRGSLAVPAVPVVLAVKLVQDWCGILSPTTANEAIRELKAAGVIVQDGYRRPFRYWPGEPQDSRSESNDRGMRPRSSLPSSH
jgi:hypothetical protein